MAHIREIHSPLVKVVDPKRRDWKVIGTPGQPQMSFEELTVWIPEDNTPYEAAIRAHESAHVRFSPEDSITKGTALYEALQPYQTRAPGLVNAAEDGRIESLSRVRGIPTPDPRDSPVYDEQRIKEEWFAPNPLAAAMYRYAVEGNDYADTAQGFVEEYWPQDAAWINSQAKRLSAPDAEFSVVMDVVRETFDVYCKEQPPEQEQKGGGSNQGSDQGEPGQGQNQEGQPQGGDPSQDGGPGTPGTPSSGTPGQEGNATESASETGDGADGAASGSGSGSQQNTGDAPSRPRPSKPITPEELQELPQELAPWNASKALKEHQEQEALKNPPPAETKEDKVADESGVDLEIEGRREGDDVLAGVKKLQNNPRSRGSALAWCQFTVLTPRLTHALPPAERGGKRGEYYGTVPRWPHRMATDRRIFARKSRGIKYPGTVVVDVSSSMSLTEADIVQVLDRYPTAEIRDYHGDGLRGWFRVVAKNGLRLTEEELVRQGSRNSIDGPALEWLAKQPRPRFWISDGMINGRNGVKTAAMYDMCIDLCLKHRIIRVENIPLFLKRYCPKARA